jgi:transcriptional regulator with XRE-family HTH domain
LVDGPVNIGHARRRPKRLAEKLVQIRTSLGVTQGDLVKRLGIEIPYSNISKFERDKSEPPIKVLLAYARTANVPLENIADDELDLGGE